MMGIVDTIMVGPLGPAAIGAVGTGSTIFMSVMVFGMGTLFSLDTYVSQSFGAGRIDECHRWLFAGLKLAAIMSVILMGVAGGLVWIMPAFGLHPQVLEIIRPYVAIEIACVIPLMLYFVFRRYLQAMNVVRPVMAALISANLVNVVGNWVLINGHWGAPAMGTNGSAWATVGARIYLAIFLIGMPGQYLFGVTHPEQYVPFRQQACAANARIACGDLYFLRIRVSSPNASTRTADYRATS